MKAKLEKKENTPDRLIKGLEKVRDESLDELLKDQQPDQDDKTVDKTVSLDEVKAVVETAQEEKPRKRRTRKPKSKTKDELEEEKKAKDVKDILRTSFAYALVGLSKAVSQLLLADKWTITDEKESEYLAGATIQYLDERFPDWEKTSPELNLAMAWSTYVVSRVFSKSEAEKFADDFNVVPGTKDKSK